MEDLYRLDDPTISCSNDIARVHNFGATVTTDFLSPVDHLLQFDHQEADADATESDMSELIKSQILSHPRYPNLVYAYIECQKVGATPELVSFLEEIGRENRSISACSQIGADPELDEFMESYCQILYCYKEELSKPFNEATTFLSDMESQLSDLCKGALTKNLDNHRIDEAGGTSEEEFSCGGEVEASENRESPDDCRSEDVKVMLRRKYSGYLSSLRKEFLKKRKKGKLPRDARVTLLDWWNNHYRWPYPTEEDKLKLSEITGLEQKQINNWFINQRKRHWKPSDDMKLALMEGVAGHTGDPMYLDHGVGTNSNNI